MQRGMGHKVCLNRIYLCLIAVLPRSQVLRLSTALKMEITAVNSLKRQLLDFSEIAENQKAQHRDSECAMG